MTNVRIKDLTSATPAGTESVPFDSTSPGTRQNTITNVVDVGNQTISNPLIGASNTANLTTVRTNLAVSGNLTTLVTSSAFFGTNSATQQDVIFFVSGAIGSKDSATRKIALMGGDLVVSGNLYTLGSSNLGQVFSTGSVAVTGSGLFKSGLTGALNFLPDGTSFLVGAGGLTTTTGSGGQISVSATTLSTSIATDINSANSARTTLSTSVATDVNSINGQLYWKSITAGQMFSTGSAAVSGSGLFKSGLTGALNKLPDGSPYLLAGGIVSLTTGSNGQITISATAGAAAAAGSTNEVQYNISNALSASNNFTFVLGAGLNVTGNLKTTVGLSGSHSTLQDGTSYLVGAGGLTTTTASNGQVTISATALSTSIATDINSINSQLGSYWISTTAGQIFTTGSVSVTGSGLFKSGLTGALNKLPDGTSFLVGTGGLTTTTGSSGQISVSATTLSTSIATDINSSNTARTTLSTSVATDINSINTQIGSGILWKSIAAGQIFTTGSIAVTGSGIFSGSLYAITTSYFGTPIASNIIPQDVSVFISGTQNKVPSTAGQKNFVVSSDAIMSGNILFRSSSTNPINFLFNGNNTTGIAFSGSLLAVAGPDGVSIGGATTSTVSSITQKDAYFFVSGAISGKNGATRNIMVVGGDMAISGNFFAFKSGTFTDTLIVPTAATGTAATSRDYVDFPAVRVTASVNDNILTNDFGKIVAYTATGSVNVVITNALTASFPTGKGAIVLLQFENSASAPFISCSGGATLNGVTTTFTGAIGPGLLSISSRNGLDWFK